MDENPYKAPREAGYQPPKFNPRAAIDFVGAAVVGVASVSAGIGGLIVGYVFWSQFFWVESRPIDMLRPMGLTLVLLTSLLSFVSAGAAATRIVKQTKR